MKDIARDILLFVTAYLPLEAKTVLPYNLAARKPSHDGVHPVRQELNVVAHSLGALCAMLAAAHAPKIFSSLTIIDPGIIPPGKIWEMYIRMPKEVMSIGLKEQYADREALVADLKKNRRTRGWDTRVLQKFVEKGTVCDEEGSIRLAAHPRLEWALYFDKDTPKQGYAYMLDIQTPWNAIMPTRPFAVPPERLTADVARLPQKTRITWIPNSTHQLPNEFPDLCANVTALWLQELAQRNQSPTQSSAQQHLITWPSRRRDHLASL